MNEIRVSRKTLTRIEYVFGVLRPQPGLRLTLADDPAVPRQLDMMAKVERGRRHDAFVGRFAVLIDGESASASEIFARVVQLEKRGFVIGDRSAGMVMESKVYPHELFVDGQVYFAASITDANLLMADGKSLEYVGVEPDILILPSAQDIAAHRDPVLAKAAGLVGSILSAEEAGSAFKEDEK